MVFITKILCIRNCEEDEMKKICFVTTVSLTIRAFVLPIIRYLSEHTDWEITVICHEDPQLQEQLPEGVRYIPVTMQRGISVGGIKAMRQMVKIFRREKFDMVQYSTPNASFYASIAAKRARTPVRLYCQWGIAYVGFAGIKRRIFKALEKMICKRSTWIEPDSFGNLKFSHEEGLYPENKGAVVWSGSACGVNLQKFDISRKAEWRNAIREQYGIGENDFVHGFIGRITGDKGVNELFEAGKKILQENPDAWLMLVGYLEKEETVSQELLQWAQNEKRVLFCGYTDVVEQYLSAMDVYILPSYREGFGSAVVEAEAMGVPVIVTDIPGPTDAMLQNRTGIVVEKGDANSLYKGMRKMQDDAEMRMQFAQKAHAFAAEHFEQTQLEEYILEDRKRLMNCL